MVLVSRSSSVHQAAVPADRYAPKTTYCRNIYQPDRTRKLSYALRQFSERAFKETPQTNVSTILANLQATAIVPFTQEEANSRKLRMLIPTHIKVQTPHFVAWIHKSDKYITPLDLYDPKASDSENLGKRYFYDASMHPSQHQNGVYLPHFRANLKFRYRMYHVMLDSFLQRIASDPSTFQKLVQDAYRETETRRKIKLLEAETYRKTETSGEFVDLASCWRVLANAIQQFFSPKASDVPEKASHVPESKKELKLFLRFSRVPDRSFLKDEALCQTFRECLEAQIKKHLLCKERSLKSTTKKRTYKRVSEKRPQPLEEAGSMAFLATLRTSITHFFLSVFK